MLGMLRSPRGWIGDYGTRTAQLRFAQRTGCRLSCVLNQESWSQKVRAILSADLAREWQLAEVCHRLATSESALRRQLQLEGMGFRDILYELRLGSAVSPSNL